MSATATSSASAPRPPAAVPSGWRAEAAAAGVAAAASLLLVAVALKLWDADLGIPLTRGGDALFFQMLVKGTVEHTWPFTNDALGAPFGQQLYDFPVAGADALPFLIVRLLGLVTSDAGTVVNLFYLLTFPLVAVAAYAVLRWLEASRPVSVACAVIFALAPYHFLRGEFHLLLSAYFAVPVLVYLVLAVLLDRPLFARRAQDPRRLRGWLSGRTLLTLGLCVLVGTSDLYYIAFALLLIAGATVLATVVSQRRLAVAATGAVLVAAVGASALVALSPTIVHRLREGANPVALGRPANESEVFSLTLMELLLPVQGHRIDRLASIQRRHETISPVGDESAPLGMVAAAGFLWLLAVAFVGVVGSRGSPRLDPRQRALATVAVGAFLIGTTGGVSALIAYGVTPQIRTWSRLSIVLGFVGLAAVALLLDAGWRRLLLRPRIAGVLRPPVAVAGLAALVLFAFLDQTNATFTPDHTEARRADRAAEAFVGQVERRVGARAAIFQIPWVRFPDSTPFAGMADYDPVRGYLHSSGLRWSYGAMKGRPADWSAELAGAAPAEVVDHAVAAGFGALWVDRGGYEDRGAAVERVIARRTGVAPLVSEEQRYAVYDLRPRARALRAGLAAERLAALRDVTLHPPRTRWDKNAFSDEERERGLVARWTHAPVVSVAIDNPSSRPRDVTLRFSLARPGAEPAAVAVRFPDGGRATVEADADGARVARRLRLAPGTSALQLATLAPPVDDGPRRLRVVGLNLAPAEVAPALAVRTRS